MFEANLSFSLLEKYLKAAAKAGFLKVENGKYTLTEQGRNFLAKYKHFNQRYNLATKLLDSLVSERELLCGESRLFDQPKPVRV